MKTLTSRQAADLLTVFFSDLTGNCDRSGAFAHCCVTRKLLVKSRGRRGRMPFSEWPRRHGRIEISVKRNF